MMLKTTVSSEEPHVVALKALAFLAIDEENLNHFLAITGLDLLDVKERANDPVMLGGVLDHLLQHENLLLAFSAELGCKPEAIVGARYRLPGANHDS
jgi:Protein of unknown function (DUF3572)